MFNPSRMIALAIAILGTTAPIAAQPTSGPELLEFVRDAHKASRQLIRTFSCRVEFTIDIAPPSSKAKQQSCSGRFWYSPDAVRAQVSDMGIDKDYLWRDSVKRTVTRTQEGSKSVAAASRANSEYRYLPRCDGWPRGMLVLVLPHSINYVPFEEFSTRATQFVKAERKSVDGKETIIVKFLFEPPPGRKDRWEVEIHFDPSVNYLVRKTIYTSSSEADRLIREEEVVQFKEVAPGVFFPERVVGRSGPDGKWYNHSTSVLSEIHVNQPLPGNIFHLRYPHNVVMTDSIRNSEYRVDSEGNRISAETPLERGILPPSASEAEISAGPQTETQEEPKSWTRWILPFSLGILLIGAVAAYIRHRRRLVATS